MHANDEETADLPRIAFAALGRLAAAVALVSAGIVLSFLAAGNASGRRHADNARRLMSGRQDRAAEAAAAQALRAFPTEPTATEVFGRVFFLRGDPTAGEAALRQAAATSPSPVDALRLLGNTLAETPGREAEGLALLERAVPMTPLSPDSARYAWLHLGQTALRAGQPERALWAFRRAEETGPPTSDLIEGFEEIHESLGFGDTASIVKADPTLRPGSD